MKIFFLLFVLRFLVHCCKSNEENGVEMDGRRPMGNITANANYYDNNEYFPSSNEFHQRKRRFLNPSLLMGIPAPTFEYFWKTFVTRFFISQNMKNFDVTTWPGKFYQKGQFHRANEKNALTALKKTFFLTKTEAEKRNSIFLASATQAAILQMSDITEAFLLYNYQKHTINVEMKELIEPSGKFRRKKKTKQLKRFLEEMFLVDFDQKVIPMLKTESLKEKLKNIIWESLEDENLLILMNDLRLFEIDFHKERRRPPIIDDHHNLHHHADMDNENYDLKEWLDSDGETTHFGIISRLFKDLDNNSDEIPSKLLLFKNDGTVKLNEKYMEKYYFHGIKLIFEHIEKTANEKLQSYERQQQETTKMEEESEIYEESILILNNQEKTKMHKLFILNELRKATCFIFSEYADKSNHHESDLIELNEMFFPGKEIVKDEMNILEMELENIEKELKNNKNEEQLRKSNSAGQLPTQQNVEPAQQRENKKSSKKMFSTNFFQTSKIFGGKGKSKGKEKMEIKSDNKEEEGNGDNLENEQNMEESTMNDKENFNTIVLEIVDISKYVLKEKEKDEEGKWNKLVERSQKQLCDSKSFVKKNSIHLDPKLKRKLEEFCKKLEKANEESKKESAKAKNKTEKVLRDISQKAKSFFLNPSDNRFGKFLEKQCENLGQRIEEANEELKKSHLRGLNILEETKKQSNKRMEKMIKRECLFENGKLLLILKRFFKLETDGILTLEFPDEIKKKDELKKMDTDTNLRIKRSGGEVLAILAMIEPIIETTILQQIFRQWNFYKWFHNCIRRSWKYKELRCKEPIVIAEEKKFAGFVTTAVFEGITKGAVQNIVALYKKFVDEILRPLKNVKIKYPSVLLKELGIKLTGIAKDWMDIEWRKINALNYLDNEKLEECKKIWEKLIEDAKEQRFGDESWNRLMEFLILTNKREHQWIVINVFCADNKVECLHKYWKKIGEKADKKRGFKLRVKGTFQKSSPNIEIAHFFELIMMRREDFYGYIFDNLLQNEDIHNGLIFPIISIGNWQKIKSFLEFYAENKMNKKKKNHWEQISEQFDKANWNKKDMNSKFILKLLKDRFERIMSNNDGKNEAKEEEEKGKIEIFCQNYGKEENTDEKYKKDDKEIINGLREIILSFDQKSLNKLKNFEENCANFIEEVKKKNSEAMLAKTKTQKIFLNKITEIVKKLKEIRPSHGNENSEGNSILDPKEELNILIEILEMSGLMGENAQYKYIAKIFKNSVLNAKFQDVRLIIANHLGLNFSKVLENYEGGIERASEEAGMWKIKGDYENDTLKINFGKMYTTILKHFAATNIENIERIKEVEKMGEKNAIDVENMEEMKEQKKILENKQMNEIDKNIKKIENFITLLKQLHSFVDEGDIEKDDQSICTPEWIEMKFLKLLNGNKEIYEEITKLSNCHLIIAQSFEKLLEEIKGTGKDGRGETVLLKGETSGAKGYDGKEIVEIIEVETKGKGKKIAIPTDDMQIETDKDDELEKQSNETDYYTDDWKEIEDD